MNRLKFIIRDVKTTNKLRLPIIGYSKSFMRTSYNTCGLDVEHRIKKVYYPNEKN